MAAVLCGQFAAGCASGEESGVTREVTSLLNYGFTVVSDEDVGMTVVPFCLFGRGKV